MVYRMTEMSTWTARAMILRANPILKRNQTTRTMDRGQKAKVFLVDGLLKGINGTIASVSGILAS